MRVWATLILLLTFVGLSWTDEATKLRVGDKVNVVVVESKDYSGSYTVLEDGSIVGVGFGRVVAGGKTVAQVQKAIQTGLKKVFKNPHIYVVVEEQKKQFVYVTSLGGPAPGPMIFYPGLDLRTAVTSVGVPQGAEIYETRLFRGGAEIARANLSEMLNGRGTAGSTKLEPNDLVALTERPIIRIWLTGLVARAGEMRIREGVDAYQAVAEAGGAANYGDQFDHVRIQVKRGEEVFDLPLQQDPKAPSTLLQANDTVIVRVPNRIRVTIGGEVKGPSERFFPEGTSLAYAIEAAGGPNGQGTRRNILVLRHGEAYQIDAVPILKGQAPPAFNIEDGDLVFVQKNHRTVTAIGFVARPGPIYLEDNKDYRLADIISEAGGANSRGSYHHVYLLRKNEQGKLVAKDFPLDRFLKTGDLTVNPEVHDGDVVMMGQPDGMDINSLSQTAYSFLLIAQLSKL